MNHNLEAAAHNEMLDHGFHPDFAPQIQTQIASIRAAKPLAPGPAVKDLRNLLWSSIDNDSSRDLDQIEYAEKQSDGSIRILIGVADVDGSVPKGSAIDQHASTECVSVYTGVETFPMLPEELSTDLTSLNEAVDRPAIVIDYTVSPNGIIQSGQSYRALVRNHAQLTYSKVGPWLEQKGEAPPKVAASADLQSQLKIQDEAAQKMRKARFESGALTIDSIETTPTMVNGQVTGLQTMVKNRATELIEDFMIGANEVIARLLSSNGASSIRRVVKTPERWPRIVELAATMGEKLPDAPDSAALNNFLLKRKAVDPAHAPDLSLAIVKLMGPGEYIVQRPGDPPVGHFGLAVNDYTHATAPNRRFADLVTQRLIKAGDSYTAGELDVVARNCTLREDMARRVERVMKKRIAAVALSDRIGQVFSGIVTGVAPKGTFVRILNPPAEGRVVKGEQGLDVGDEVRVKLLATDPQKGFIDFGRTS
ncbi:MAG TPA: RNB domain-containing ribonuclease [Bryobacteraceae bacterium]|jgi:exoribonuclease-2|nr:RNB domain-containing ribonuclease [Bryobacteraceae bacterium]